MQDYTRERYDLPGLLPVFARECQLIQKFFLLAGIPKGHTVSNVLRTVKIRYKLEIQKERQVS